VPGTHLEKKSQVLISEHAAITALYTNNKISGWWSGNY
jgi:hypothetical protein